MTYSRWLSGVLSFLVLAGVTLASSSCGEGYKVGDCMYEVSTSDIRRVDCSDPRAEYRILKINEPDKWCSKYETPGMVAEYSVLGSSTAERLCLGRK